jgi:LAO/AO transport system kinase
LYWKEKYEQLIHRFKAKDTFALAKMITLVENNILESWEIISKLQEDSPPKNSYVIGITGSSGVGKSTFISGLVQLFLESEEKIGIILIDPSSPFSGGAFLGDRIRMFELSKFSNVYIRSVASRGAVGGLCNSIYDIIDIMKSFGFDKIIVETVGAGQTETEIFYACDSVILILSPDSGDEVQIFKAGIMEIADCYVVNKIDLPSSKKFMVQMENFINSEKSIQKKLFGVSSLEKKGLDKIKDWIELQQKEQKDTTIKNEIRRKIRVKNFLINSIENIINNISNDNDSDIFSLRSKVINCLCSKFGGE